MPDGKTGQFRDPRFTAAVLLSAQGPDQQGLHDNSWRMMNGPMMNVTGTLDRGAKGGDWRWKAQPYELSPRGGTYLMGLDDGDHYLGGFATGTQQQQVPAQREAVKQTTQAFLDAHLGANRAALEWLGSVSHSIAGCRVLFKRK